MHKQEITTQDQEVQWIRFSTDDLPSGRVFIWLSREHLGDQTAVAEPTSSGESSGRRRPLHCERALVRPRTTELALRSIRKPALDRRCFERRSSERWAVRSSSLGGTECQPITPYRYARTTRHAGEGNF
jgi:hypothetical protein